MKLKRRMIEEKAGFGLLRAAAFLIIGVILILLYDIFPRGRAFFPGGSFRENRSRA